MPLHELNARMAVWCQASAAPAPAPAQQFRTSEIPGHQETLVSMRQPIPPKTPKATEAK